MTSGGMATSFPGDWGWAFAKGRGGPRPRPDDLERLAELRHLGSEGPLGSGPMFGGGHLFGGGPPFGGGRGRKRRGDVRVALLLLLAEEPRNGYQLMQAIEERSAGRWRPSPGSVYPALAQLEDEGLIRPTEREGSKLLEITDAGRKHLEQRVVHEAPWEVEEDPAFKPYEDLRSLIKQVHIAAIQVGQAGDEHQIASASEILAETRRALYRILAEDTDA
jgi:DNA-binding PadR family transcriptional regulator